MIRPPERSRRVLLVDDDPTVITTFLRMLNLEGFAVRCAGDAETGLREAAAFRPDAILLDLRMPLVDGLDFLRRLRGDEHIAHTPVAIVTGDYFAEDTLGDILRSLGATIHFKPLWLDDLIPLVRQLVDGVKT